MGLPALLADYLFLGPLIQERLKEQVLDVPVDLCETADQVLKADQRARVLMVMWAGERFVESEAGRVSNQATQTVYQRWLVLLAINNPSAYKDARHKSAGQMLSAIHGAIAGWKPEGCTRAMQRAAASLRPDITATKAIYPLGFELQLYL
jgi:hypothetical protein